MKKLLGLYHHQENQKGNFYNFYPVSVLSDEGINPIIYPIEWGQYVDPVIGDLFPGYHNINIACSREYNNDEYVFGDALNMFDPQTWGVLDIDFANQYAKTNRGKSNYIPFIALRNTNINLTDNDCCIVIGRNLIDSNFEISTISFAMDEEFYILESNSQLSGPYIKTSDHTYEKCDNFSLWTATVEPSFLYCDVYVDDESESYSIQLIHKNNIKEAIRSSSKQETDAKNEVKPAIAEEHITKAEEPQAPAVEEEIEETEQINSIWEAFDKYNASLPSDYEFGKVTIENLEKKVAKKFNVTEFKNYVKSGNAEGTKALYKELGLFNAISEEMIDAQLAKKAKGKAKIIIPQQYKEGYLEKVTIEGLGEYFRASERGAQALEKSTCYPFLGLEHARNSADEYQEKPASHFAARLAYTKIMADIYSYFDNESASISINDDCFFSFLRDKNSIQSNAVFGVFDKEIDYDSDDFHEIKANGSGRDNVIRLITAGINKEHSLAIAKALNKFFGDTITPHIFAYALDENKYYDLETEEQIGLEEIWSAKIDEEATAKYNALQAKDAAIKEQEEKAKQKEAEAKKKRIADEKAQAAHEAQVKSKALKLEEEAKQLIAETIEKQKQEESKLHAIEQQNSILQKNVELNQARVDSLTKQAAEIVKNAKKALESPEFARVTMDGELAYRMRKAAAEWEDHSEIEKYKEYCNVLSEMTVEDVHGTVISYVVDKILKARPTYSRNDVINIAICIAQGFITVFSGTPGSGKTSICNLFGQVLGLDIPVDNYPYTRYVPVSVGRGWTSQRDFIGYYNPLSKEFDKSNQQVFDTFSIANEEQENSKYPLMILLDEANLSPMEHYWSEFIRICDDREKYNTINCGGEHRFNIPKTMRFLATINNDDTTTTLSPRMIDRSWIITLPELKAKDLLVKGRNFEEDELVRITWDAFYDAFGPKEATSKMENEVENLLSDIRDILPDFPINNRMYQSMVDYYSAAKACFDTTDNSVAPLDYAVAQRVLPKISGVDGQTDSYKDRLTKLKEYLESPDREYTKSAEIVNKIIKRGEDIGFYQFF